MKDFKIEVPEGYEIDQEKSTFERIVFKKKFFDYTNIKSFNDAIDFLRKNVIKDQNFIENIIKDIDLIKNFSRSLSAEIKLRLIRKALNYGQESYGYLGEDYVYYPTVRLHTTKDNYGTVVGKVMKNSIEFFVINYEPDPQRRDWIKNTDLYTYTCITPEIAQHFGDYFWNLILEAQLADSSKLEILN